MTRLVAIALFLLALVPGSAPAEVVERAPGAFVSRNTVTVAVAPDRAFRALVDEVGSWWNKAHTFSGEATNLTLSATPGGCLCETLPNGGSVVHAVVNHAAPGELLRLSGALGPLQEHAITGTLTFAFEKAGQGTRATVTYRVTGYFPGGLEKIAGPVDSVIGEQLQRLKEYLDKAR